MALPLIFQELNKIKQSAQIAEDLRGRYIGGKYGIVTTNEDPENLRRIKVQLSSMPRGVESYWVMRHATSPNIDEPVPRLGDTVLVNFVDGDITKGLYTVLQNKVNTPIESDNPLIDYSHYIEGDKNLAIDRNYNIDVKKDITESSDNLFVESGTITEEANTTIDLKAGTSITIKAGAATILTIHSDGSISLVAPTTVNVVAPIISLNTGGITMSGINGGTVSNAVLNVDNLTLNGNFRVTGNSKVNNKNVAVVGATDNDGDVIVSSGQ